MSPSGMTCAVKAAAAACPLGMTSVGEVASMKMLGRFDAVGPAPPTSPRVGGAGPLVAPHCESIFPCQVTAPSCTMNNLASAVPPLNT